MDLTHLFNLQTACFRHAQNRISVVLNLKSCLSFYFQPNLSAFVRLWVNINSAKQNQNIIWLNKLALCCCSSFVDYSLLRVGYWFPINAQRSFFVYSSANMTFHYVNENMAITIPGFIVFLLNPLYPISMFNL